MLVHVASLSSNVCPVCKQAQVIDDPFQHPSHVEMECKDCHVIWSSFYLIRNGVRFRVSDQRFIDIGS